MAGSTSPGLSLRTTVGVISLVHAPIARPYLIKKEKGLSDENPEEENPKN